MRKTPFVLICLLTGACTAPRPQLAVAPDIVSARWQGPAVGAAPPQRLGEAFGVPALTALVERARADNPELGAAVARIERARAELQLARAESLPSISLSAGLREIRTDDRGGSTFDFSAGTAALDIAWEADLFGRLAAGRRSARARAAAAAFDADAVALALEAELARALVQHAALSARIDLLERNLTSARDLERILGVRQRLGAATRVETGRQAIEVRELELERTRLFEARNRTRNALAVLTGSEAPAFTAPAIGLETFRMPPLAAVPPADLLVRRPDIRAAEARIAAANGDVDQARAAFLPQLRLSTAAIGQAAALSGPVGATLSLGADLLAPIFNRPRLRGQLAAVSAGQREAVELYRAALLRALGEAEDALAAAEAARQRGALVNAIIADARETARLARLQYLEGDADLQTAIDAERRLIALEDTFVLTLQERLNAAIDLYRAMGGASAGPATSS